MKKYKVIEDNGGGLHLLVLVPEDDNRIEWYGTNFEYPPVGILTDCIKALKEGANPLIDFGDNFLDDLDDMMDKGQLREGDVREVEYHFSEEGRRNGAWDLIADNEGVYPENMGYSGKNEFK